MIFLFTILTFFSTLAGGLFAFRHKDKPGLVSGFSAGAVIGVSFFDLLPESFSLGNGYFTPGFITALAALGFFYVLNQVKNLLSISRYMKTCILPVGKY